MSTSRRWAARFALAALSSLLALGAAEGLARVIAPPEAHQVDEAESWDAQCLRPLDGPGYGWVPGQCGANEQGFLGPAVDSSPAPGTLRIVLLGDSISGDGRFGRWTAELLSQELDRPVEVLNFGVFGFNPDNELGMWRAVASAYEPHIVIHQFCVNDYQHTPVFYRQGGRLMTADNKNGQLSGVPIGLYQRSALMRWVVGVRTARSASEKLAPFEQRTQPVEDAMRALDQELSDAGIPWLSVRFPYLAEREEWTPEFVSAEEHFGGLIQDLGVRQVDLGPRYQDFGPDRMLQTAANAQLDTLRATGSLEGLEPEEAEQILGSAKHYFPKVEDTGAKDRIHPNAFGHYFAARAITDLLVRDMEQLVPGMEPPAPALEPLGRTRTPADR